MSASPYLPAQSVLKDILQEIGASLNLDSATLNNAHALHQKYVASETDWTPAKVPTTARCAVLIAAKTTMVRTVGGEVVRGSQVSLANLLGPVDTHDFILQLKDFLRKGLTDEADARELNKLINVYAFCMTFHAKYDEIWNKLNFSDRSHRPETLTLLKQVCWLVYILARANLCQKRTEVVECACMLIGAFNFTLQHLPSNIETSLDSTVPILVQLCGLLKANVDQAQIASDHIVILLRKFKGHGMLRGNIEGEDLEGVLSNCHLGFNINNLSALYQQALLPEEIDERVYTSMKSVSKAHIKAKAIAPFAKHGKPLDLRQMRSRRTLNFEESIDTSDISLSSKLHDIKLTTSKSPFTEATPMSLALEINRWLIDLTDDVSLDEFSEGLLHYFSLSNSDVGPSVSARLRHMKETLTNLFEDCNIKTVTNDITFIEMHFQSAPVLPSATPVENEKLQSVLKLYLRSLEGMLQHEETKQDKVNFNAILQNSSFHQALYACCLETTFFVHNITALTFEEILKACEISAFEFWKLINTFSQFDPRMPLRLKRHFKDLEVKILSLLGWEQNSPIHLYLRKVEEGSSTSDLNLKSYDMFFRRVLSQAAHRILELSEHLGFADDMREEIWTVLKYALSEQTELMINRHLDQVILCSLYSVWKLNFRQQASFKVINDRYSELYNEDNAKVLRFVRLDGDTTGDIIKFYNDVYIQAMKLYLTKEVRAVNPRIAALNPPSPLRANLAGPMHYTSLASPMTSPGYVRQSPNRPQLMTPRTANLYAFGESPSRNLDSINRMISQHCIDFDAETSSFGEPKKRPRHLAEIMEQNEDSFSRPSLKKAA